MLDSFVCDGIRRVAESSSAPALLTPIWSALNNLPSVGLANTLENLELFGSGCMGVEEIDFLGGDEDKVPTKRDGNNTSHDGKQKACSDECA